MEKAEPWHEDDAFWETWGPVMFSQQPSSTKLTSYLTRNLVTLYTCIKQNKQRLGTRLVCPQRGSESRERCEPVPGAGVEWTRELQPESPSQKDE